VYEVKSVGHVEDTAFAPSLSAEEDIPIYEKAVEYNPHDLWLILDLAHYYFDKEEYEKAADKYKSAIEIDPKFAPAHMYLGRALYRNLCDKDALSHLERARELNPDFFIIRLLL
jgi:tetratricopeptide (TPR) repeat protein